MKHCCGRDVSGWDDDRTALLIQLFRQRRELWDPASARYSCRQARSEAWAEVSARLHADQRVLQRRINKLILRFDLEVDKKKAQPGKDCEEEAEEWCFYRPLMFLRERNVAAKSSAELTSDEDNVLEKAKMWDWVLLLACLLTAVYWHLMQLHGYWGPRPEPANLALTQSEQWLQFGLHKLLAGDEEVCFGDSTQLKEDQPSISSSTGNHPSGRNCSPHTFLIQLHTSDFNFTQKDLFVPNLKLPMDQLTLSAFVSTCVLSNWNAGSGDGSGLRLPLNSTAFSTAMQLTLLDFTSFTVISSNATTAFSMTKPLVVGENVFVPAFSHKQNRFINTLANLTDKLKNKFPNGT